MDKVCSEANEENDNRERTSRRRHSSILKPPRSPLQDLRSGNEAVQESIPTRTRKSSRRVSFADTIKIFQAESHMKIFRKSEIAEKEAGENVLLTQNKNSEDNHSEITGMNTLLCAPIQIQMQQKEFSVTEHSHERKHENDQTIIYLDENQMDLTASHTVMIAKSVLDCSKDEKSTKIDTKSFLASLKLHTEESRVKKELSISTDQRNSSEKKINFNDFIKRLKMGKSNTSPFNESDKENCELSIHAKEVNNASSLHHLHTSPHEDETSSNRTRNFGRQDDGMNFTQCHTTNIQALIPVSTEACLKETKNNDITICGNDCMDFTVNHTVQILTSADNLSKIENQTQNINVDTTGYGNESPRKQENFKSRPNAAFQDSTLRAEDEVKITKSHMAAESHTVTQTCEQHVIESAHSSPTIRDDKTVFYSTYSDGMELTKCVSSMPEEKDLSKNDSNYYKIYSNSGATSLLTEKTFYPGDDSMDITRSHTVVIDNELFKQGETNVQTEAIPISGKGTLFQNHPAVAEDGKMKVNFSSVPHVSKERLQQGLGNLLSISLTDRKTKLFTDEDTDLTTCYIAHLGSQTPLASFNLALENTNKCHSSSKSLTSEWGGKKKKHSVPSPKSNVVFETTIGDKGKENISKTSLSLDKGFPQSVDYNQNIEKTQNRISNKDLDEEVALGMSKNIVSCEKTLFSATKPSFMSERQILLKNNTVVNSPNMVSVPGENSKLPESLRKSLGGPSLNCSYDKMAICSVEEQNMDLTKSDTVVIGFGPSETQELDKTNLEHIGSELTRVSRQIALKIEKCNQNLMGKTGVFMSNRTERQDKIIQKSGLLHEMQNVKIHSRKSVGGLKIDKTILFSEGDENDMDITKSYTVEIKRKPSLEEYDSHLMPLAGTSKTVSYSCEQDDMEITNSHTVPLECKNISPEEVPSRLLDKTATFVDDVDDLEMTKAHTIIIDYQTKERTVLPDRSNCELPEVNSQGIPKATATPDEESVFFPEDDESGHPVAKRSQLTLQVEGCNSEPVDRAHANMEVPTSLVWRNDTDTQKPGFLNEPHLGQSLRRKSLGLQNDKTVIFSESDKNDMDITQSCMMDINNKSALKSQKDSCLLPMEETFKTVLYTCGQDDMEITRSHTVPLECKNILPEEVPTRLLNKTVMFVDDVDDLEMTKAHTILIDYQTKERTVLPVRSNSELPEVNSPGIPKATATPDEESVFFPEDDESGHPVAKRSQLTLQVEGCNSEPVDRAHANMEVPTSLVWRNDTDTQKPGFLNEPHLGQSLRRKSLGHQNDKTIIFSASDKNDMDITQSCMMDINNKSALKGQKDSCLLPLKETSKTVLYTCEQDDMEITNSHTVPLECKNISPEEVPTRLLDKTATFVDDVDDLEMTKAHTILIDYQTKERTVLPVRSNSELPEVNSPGISKTTATPDEESVFFPEDGESGHPVAKRSQLTLQVEGCNSEPVDRAHANMEVPTSLVWRNDTDTQKPGFLNEPHLGQSLRRKSLGLQNDKTVIFSESDKNDMDITQSCMMDINNKSALKDQKDSCLLPVEETSKTVLYTCGQDDMEITRSHTIPLECKYILPDEINTKPIDKTVMFVDNHNDLEVTKSQAVFIDCQTMENICKEYPVFERTKETTLSVSFSKNDSCFHEVTKKGAQAKGNIILNTEQYHMIPSVPTNSLSGDQGEMKITKFYSTAIDKEAKEKVLDKACTVGKAKIENCHLNKIDRENVDFASNGKVAFGSSDSYCCLPNVMSCVDNMEENIMTLYDKDKEEASNCPKQSDLMPEDYLKCEELPVSTSHPLLSTEITQTNTKGCLDTIVPQLKDLEDLPKVPQNLLANQTWGEYKDLGEMNKLNSKRVSFKLPNDPVEAFPDNAEHSLKMTFVDDCVASQPYSSPLPLLPQEQYVVNKDQTMLSKAEYENLNTIKGNSFPPICEHEPTELKNGKEYTISCKKELKENMQTTKYSEESDFHNNSDLTLNSPRKPLDTVIASDAPSVSSIKPYLNDFSGKIENVFNFPVVHISPPPEQLPELANEAPNNMGIMHATDKHNIDMVSSNPEDDRIEENKNFHKGSEVTSESLTRVVKDKVRKCSLGIFVPRLPNKRNHSVTSMDDLEPIPANITDANHLETHPICNKDSGIGFIATKLNLSPSQYINEENLPVCPEINFSDSISIENEENTLIETDQKEIAPFENQAEETCTSQKRTWVQEDEDNIQNEKKIRRDELGLCDAAQDPQICSYHTEGDADKNANSMLMKSLNRTPSSCSSSLDSVKADGTSLDLTTHRNSQMESQFLRDAICEENLREKLKDGKITIREFFILLQVHILIQKPRQSNLPTKFTTNTPPTPEDLMLSQYVYRPKILVYKEDCEALQQKIEELKLSALNQDKLLIDVNKNLWEEMRHSSEEQLKNFGIYLNRIKSRFSKLTKVFTHQGKLALYSKLVQSAQNEREKLQIRMHEIDNILKKIDNCLIKVEIETRCLEDAEKDNLMEKWNSKMRAGEKELEQLKNKEEELQRYLLDLQVQKEQTLAQIDSVQKETKKMEDVVDQLSLSEWEIIEWSDDQAVFTFLYDTIELTLSFGEAIVGLPFLDKDHRKIANLNFQSVLDEDKAPPSSLLVHKLIFQYIEEQEYWKKKCTTQHQVPKMLQEISLVVSHCRLLGEEIEFLKRWGPNYNLMNIDINNTELTLLFSSSAAFAKFEITLSLSAHYPSILLPFCIQNHLGNIDQDEIAAILSNVPLEDNYLKNVVKRIHGNLLQDSRVHQQIIGP